MKINTSRVILLLTYAVFGYSNTIKAQQTPAGKDWIITDPNEIQRIHDRLYKCDLFHACHTPDYTYPNTDQYNYLVATYGKNNLSLDDIRFTSKDESKYAKLWGLKSGSAETKVAGYHTQIYKIRDTTNAAMVTTTYSYVNKICPPPRGGCSGSH